MRSNSSGVKARASALMTAWSGMTLIAFPPWIIVTLTVVSFAEFASEASCKAWWDASTMALRPFSGSKPECAARPMISTVITAEIIGRAAHSGLEPEKGRNAIVEASHQALQLASLANSAKETTVNVTMIQGGNAINVIPDHAVIKADARAFTPEEFDRVETSLQKLASDTIVPEVQVKASMTRNFPPWPRAASTDALLARAQKLYAEIGGKLAGVRSAHPPTSPSRPKLAHPPSTASPFLAVAPMVSTT